ncbi:lethal(3)malignant brain tumor-like protein 3 [Pleurodeles waltl]|uniref:lethal(3)malignant brain tumor-like protein 3 n=1 Tax=Pleurodeles waltl TaxID=8319 RepID=UPI003709B8EE
MDEKPTPAQSQDFDLMSALDWNEGVATLPGSNIRFRMSEFGTLELVTEVEETDMPDTVKPAPTGHGCDTTSGPLDGSPCTNRLRGGLLASRIQEEACTNCGYSGKTEIFTNGKFCSWTCSQQHKKESKESQNLAKNQIAVVTESERPQRLRRKRKLLMDSDDDDDILEEEEEKSRANILRGRKNAKQMKTVAPAKRKVWNWVSYLEEEKMPAAPVKLFKEYQSFPLSKNGFKVGMKMEALDPDHPALFCVVTVAEVHGYRMRLHFDGYPDCYDFWTNADSPDIHPIGWCEKTGHKLLPPKGFKDTEFNWAAYLKNSKAQAAPKNLFKSINTPVTPSGFRVGMKLEAVDKKNPALMCVATITDMVENRLLIHFDNWDESYDYWCDSSSPYIRPIGYCQETGTTLTVPPEYKDPKNFSWEKYLEETSAQAAPARAFKLRPPHGFLVNMKLEVVDKRNPMLIRVASIADKEDHRLKIHFDGWSSFFDFWVDADSPDIHPVGWCAKTGHTLQLPPGPNDVPVAPGQSCPTPGCKGLGHIRGPRFGTHHKAAGCPYSDLNLSRESILQDRLSGERPLPSNSMQKPKRPDTPSLPGDLPSDSPHSKKSLAADGERSGRSSVLSLSELSENGHEKDWPEEEPSADTKPKLRRVTHSRAYIRLQLVQQDSDGKDTEFTLQQGLHQSVFMSSLSSNPMHRLHLCWEQHCKLLPEVSGFTAKKVAKWTIEEVASFVHRLPGCKEQSSVFKDEQIDGEAFLLLTQMDMVKILSIKLGPALKIYNAILMFKTSEEN